MEDPDELDLEKELATMEESIDDSDSDRDASDDDDDDISDLIGNLANIGDVPFTFFPPMPETITRALGSLRTVPSDLHKYFAFKPPSSTTSFAPVPLPRDDDWLANHREAGQTLSSFRRMRRLCLCCQPCGTNRSIFIQPIGHSFDSPLSSGGRVVSMDLIRRFLCCFFYGLDCVIRERVDVRTENGQREEAQWNENSESTIVPENFRFTVRMVPGWEVKKGEMNDGLLQVHTTPVLDWMADERLREMDDDDDEDDVALDRASVEVATIGIVYPFDLYPDPRWNFVFGIARIPDGFGVYSLARLDPRFPAHLDAKSVVPTEDERKLILRRSLSIVSHEISHVFGLQHCVFFSCLMLGANHQQESDEAPPFLCPVCLCKLWESLRFDIPKRYLALKEFYSDCGLVEESQWIENRLNEIEEE